VQDLRSSRMIRCRNWEPAYCSNMPRNRMHCEVADSLRSELASEAIYFRTESSTTTTGVRS
jgi:hypothetical protein